MPSRTSFGTLIIHTTIPHWGTNLFARICLSTAFQSRRSLTGEERWIDGENSGIVTAPLICDRHTRRVPRLISRLAQQSRRDQRSNPVGDHLVAGGADMKRVIKDLALGGIEHIA